MKAIIKLKQFNRECEVIENFKQLQKKMLDLNDGEEIRITLKLNGEQRKGMGDMGFKFAENLVEGMRWKNT